MNLLNYFILLNDVILPNGCLPRARCGEHYFNSLL